VIRLACLDVTGHLLEGLAAVGEVTILLPGDGDEGVAFGVRPESETVVFLAEVGIFSVNSGHGATSQS